MQSVVICLQCDSTPCVFFWLLSACGGVTLFRWEMRGGQRKRSQAFCFGKVWRLDSVSMLQSPQVLGGCNKCNVSPPAACALGVGAGRGGGGQNVCLSKSVCTHWLACWLAFSMRRPLCWRWVMGKGWRGAMQTRVECWFKATSRQEESELAFTWESVFGMWEREWTSFL